jgi:hypothetical protein
MSRDDAPSPAYLFVIGESPQDRTARVEAIREHVAAGSYDVPAEDVADVLVAFFRRDFLPDQDRNAGFVAKSC